MNKLMNKIIHQNLLQSKESFAYFKLKMQEKSDKTLIYDAIGYISVIKYRLARFGRD